MKKEETIELTIDGEKVTVPKGTTVHAAAEKLEIKVPIFCYHDRMPPFGACRICLVEIEGLKGLRTSCTTEATEGMVVKTQSEKAVHGRNEIMELLLINHPLDCPVCDRGGECPLQEHTLHHGPGKSRFFEEKRHFKKPVPRGPVLMLDRERCIACARCTRFGEIIAGDNALEFVHRGYQTEVGTPDDGPAKSKFIGNTIMICPVGALTSQVYRFRARPWDNDSVNSTCTLCPVGCSLVLDSRDGEIMRTRACENKNVNDIWLCDKGWFGYEFSSDPLRLQKPLVRKNGLLEEASWEEALSFAATSISEAKTEGKVAALGGNTLTVEESFLFQKLIREATGSCHLDHRIGMPIIPLDEEGVPPGLRLPIREIEELDYAVLMGLDLTEEFPILWLRLKQAINKGATVDFLGHYAPEISRYFSKTILHTPGKEIETVNEHLRGMGDVGKGAIFIGRQYLHHPLRSVILANLQQFTKENPHITLNLLEGQENSAGARFAGMRPDMLPENVPIKEPGLDTLAILEKSATDGWDLLYIAGANPAAQVFSPLWKKARENLGCLIVQDLFLTETAKEADIVFPSLSFLEKEGSFINIEGRIQKISPGKTIPEGLLSDAEIFTKLAELLNIPLPLDDSFAAKLRQEKIPPEQFVAVKIPQEKTMKPDQLAATFASALFDQGVRMKHNRHLSEFSKDPGVRIHPSEGEKRGIDNGENVEFSANGNTITARVVFDENVAFQTAVFPLGFKSIPSQDLGKNLINGMAIEIRKRD